VDFPRFGGHGARTLTPKSLAFFTLSVLVLDSVCGAPSLRTSRRPSMQHGEDVDRRFH
jgi:hypothetical protein